MNDQSKMSYPLNSSDLLSAISSPASEVGRPAMYTGTMIRDLLELVEVITTNRARLSMRIVTAVARSIRWPSTLRAWHRS